MVFHDLPDLSRETLLELGGSAVYRDARDLLKRCKVEDLRWDKPVLKGTLTDGSSIFRVEMDLRSLTFVKVRCQCRDGRAGRVCPHATALAMALRNQVALAVERAAKGEQPVEPETGPPPPKSTLDQLRSIREDADGLPLRVRLLLPPNFDSAASRDAIMVKMECIAGRDLLPPEHLQRGKGYQVSATDRAVLAFIEQLSGGRLHSMLQLNGQQLKQIVELWGDTPLLYAGATAIEPIGLSDWKENWLPKCREKQPDPRRQLQVRRRAGFTESRSRPKPPPLEHADKWMVIDGSPHFLSVSIRDREHPLYRRAVDLLRSSGFHNEPSNGKWWLRDQHKVLNFLARNRAEIDHVMDPGYTSNFQQRTGGIAEVGIEVEVQSLGAEQQVQMSLSVKGMEEREIHKAIASGKNYIVTEDRIHLLPPQKLEKFHSAARALTGERDRAATAGLQLRLRPENLPDAEKILEDFDLEVPLPEDWTKRSAALREVGRLEKPPLAESLACKLRTYQLIGVGWLWHLYKNRLGGILADEMGLGKTLQAIALIHCLGHQKALHVPAIVVAPASLLTNWRKEISIWDPALKVCLHHGSARATDTGQLQAFDVVITSYGTLRNDIELLLELESPLAIADEAQHIKNRRTGAARALRQLSADCRFVLTGTPIENSVEDLRSLFDFCLPGYLGRRESGLKGEDKKWEEQRVVEKAAPYILRRSKREVAPELPEKIEQVVWCEMGVEQRKLYDGVRERCERALLDMTASGASENRIRFAVLTELLRLRQVCAEPRLLEEAFDPSQSAKLNAFDEILSEALDGGHRILVFSQFVQLLKRLALWLEERGHRYESIDGKTRDRLGVCERFNADREIPVCLISLKAGGTGLNLTGANTVVHFDPWWNPAVEDQATDRAHRIGQQRTVTSYKLVTVGTVEEKVLEYQTKKASLLRSLLDESEAQTAKVDLDTLRGLIS